MPAVLGKKKGGGRHEHSTPTTTNTIDGLLNWREVGGGRTREVDYHSH